MGKNHGNNGQDHAGAFALALARAEGRLQQNPLPEVITSNCALPKLNQRFSDVIDVVARVIDEPAQPKDWPILPTAEAIMVHQARQRYADEKAKQDGPKNDR